MWFWKTAPTPEKPDEKPPMKRRRVDDGEGTSDIQTLMRKQDEMSKHLGILTDFMKNDRKKSTEKEFVLRQVFENVSELEEGVQKYGMTEEHFGQEWWIFIMRKGEHLSVYLAVNKPDSAKEWSIETKHELELVVENRNFRTRRLLGKLQKEGNAYGASKFLNWEEMKKTCLKDDKLEVQARVKVLKMTGIVKPKVFDFGIANKEHSDVILRAGNENFYLQRGYLAHHSPYFRAYFSKYFKEGQSGLQEFDLSYSDYFRRFFSKNFKEGQSGLQEFPLSNTDAQDFQNFLEVLYGNAKVDEFTLEGILLLSDFYDTANVREACEEFLMAKSELTMKKKLELSSRFQLNALADKCTSEIKTHDEYKSLVAEGVLKDANLYVAKALAEKAATF